MIRITEENAFTAIRVLPKKTQRAIWERLHDLADRTHTSANTFRRKELPRLVAQELSRRDLTAFVVHPIR